MFVLPSQSVRQVHDILGRRLVLPGSASIAGAGAPARRQRAAEAEVCATAAAAAAASTVGSSVRPVLHV